MTADVTKPHPMALRDGDRDNFTTLQKAHEEGALCLISAKRKSDGAKVALVCAMSIEGEGEQTFYCPVPLAVMIEGNPYEIFEDPTAETADQTSKGKKA